MTIKYDLSGINSALAARIQATLEKARQVPNSRFAEIEKMVEANNIKSIRIVDQAPNKFDVTNKNSAYLNAIQDDPFDKTNRTLVIVMRPDRAYVTASEREIDPGIGVIHEMSHNQLGRPQEATPEGEVLARQDHIDVGRQLRIPDGELSASV